MTLTRWNPMPNLTRWDQGFDEMMKRFWGHDDEMMQSVWAPRVDITETEDHYLLTADLPGLSREDIDITLENGELRISGERVLKRDEKKENVRLAERAHGRFVRSFQLNNAVEESRIKARFQDGVLHLELPKVEKKKPKRIRIEG